MVKERVVIALKKHEVAYQDMIALIRKHEHELSAAQILAVGANMLGKLIALQDQRTMTKELAMEIVARNLELGNAEVIEKLRLEVKGSA